MKKPRSIKELLAMLDKQREKRLESLKFLRDSDPTIPKAKKQRPNGRYSFQAEDLVNEG